MTNTFSITPRSSLITNNPSTMIDDTHTITIKEFIDQKTTSLRKHQESSPRLDIELMVCHICHLDRVGLIVHSDQPLNHSQRNKLQKLVQRRIHGEPMAYILRYKDFYKYRFFVDKRVLVPRPETEGIVEKVLQWGGKNKNQPYQILDMGTGCGCIGLSLAKQLSKKISLDALDLSLEALDVFQKNAQQLGLSKQVTSINLDAHCAAKSLPHNFYDIIVANPPYISHNDTEVCKNVLKYEPAMALFSQKGWQAPMLWMKQASYLLKKKNSIFIMELGLGQGDLLKEEAQKLPSLGQIQLIKDYTGRKRFLLAIQN